MGKRHQHYKGTKKMVHVRLDELTLNHATTFAKGQKITLSDYLRMLITLGNDQVRRGELLWSDQK
jgi:hypothetical protein